MKKFRFISLFSLVFFTHIYATEDTTKKRPAKKEWNYMVYFASNNDLYQFSTLNIHQMLEVGSTEHINLLIQQDTYGEKEVSRFLVKKNKMVLKEKIKNTQEAISGTPESLYKFLSWGIKNFPAKHHALVLWNHGSGIEDPSIWGKSWPSVVSGLYSLNPATGLMELNRKLFDDRGIAFNDIFEEYLTNQDLKNTLEKVSKKLLKGKKIDIVGMDACNMAMLEVGSELKNCVHYMVGSEETEPGTGWNYTRVLKPFRTKALTPKEFATQIVTAYAEEYKYKYSDITQSAIDLTNHDQLEANIDGLSQVLLTMLDGKDKETLLDTIKKIRNNKKLTTVFANKNYIDMTHFYRSFHEAITSNKSKFENKKNIEALQVFLVDGVNLLRKHVIASHTNKKQPFADGLSFYFPSKKIHKSYMKTTFAENAWVEFLELYIKETRPTYTWFSNYF